MRFTVQDYWIPFLWGLLMLLAWIGWGNLVRFALRLQITRIDLGLRAAWGMSATLLLAGFLQLFSLCNAFFFSLLVYIGLALFLSFQLKSFRLPRLALHLLPIAFLLLFFYATSIQRINIDFWDDAAAYFVFPQRLLHQGILLDPWSIRRMLTFGGQSVFDATLLLHASYLNIDILELGLARILFALLLFPLIPKHRPWPTAIALTLLLLIPIPHVNIQSQMTGCVLFLALLRTYRFTPLAQTPIRHALAIGLVAGSFATLRATFVIVILLTLLLTHLVSFFDSKDHRTMLLRITVATATFILFLLPWSTTLYRSSHTFLYPFMPGTQNPDYDYLSANLTFPQTLNWAYAVFAQPQVWILLLIACFALLPRFRKIELPFALAAISSSTITIFTYTLTQPGHHYRFLFPTFFALAAFLILQLLRRPARFGSFALALPLALLAISMIPFSPHNSGDIWGLKNSLQASLQIWNQPDHTPIRDTLNQKPLYLEAQSSVPPGKPIFAATSAPFLFDFARNPIITPDMVGAASPPPGMPLLKSPEAVQQYLLSLQIEYIIHIDFDQDPAHLSRQGWSNPSDTPGFTRVAPFNLALIEVCESLASSNSILYESPFLRVIHLTPPSSQLQR